MSLESLFISLSFIYIYFHSSYMYLHTSLNQPLVWQSFINKVHLHHVSIYRRGKMENREIGVKERETILILFPCFDSLKKVCKKRGRISKYFKWGMARFFRVVIISINQTVGRLIHPNTKPLLFA